MAIRKFRATMVISSLVASGTTSPSLLLFTKDLIVVRRCKKRGQPDLVDENEAGISNLE
jgi:hypothetical protein